MRYKILRLKFKILNINIRLNMYILKHRFKIDIFIFNDDWE